MSSALRRVCDQQLCLLCGMCVPSPCGQLLECRHPNWHATCGSASQQQHQPICNLPLCPRRVTATHTAHRTIPPTNDGASCSAEAAAALGPGQHPPLQGAPGCRTAGHVTNEPASRPAEPFSRHQGRAPGACRQPALDTAGASLPGEWCWSGCRGMLHSWQHWWT